MVPTGPDVTATDPEVRREIQRLVIARGLLARARSA
jgi:hypothetical protein